MGGGLMQLVAYGAQDIYLTGNPQITFFKVVYRRHTNFSVESIEQTFNGTNDFGNTVTATISRNGDLVTNMYLQFDLNALSTVDDDQPFWTDEVGNALVEEAELEIGGQRIDKHFSEWLSIWSELNLSESQKGSNMEVGYNSMVGRNPVPNHNAHLKEHARTARTYYVPLRFWFNRNPGLALPLIALQYHEVKIKLKLRSGSHLVRLTNNKSGPSFTTTLSNASLWVDYVYLDTDERRRFAQVSHEYLIEQVQQREETVGNVTDKTVDLNFNHPVKELVWVMVQDAKATGGTSGYNAKTGNQWLNFAPEVGTTGNQLGEHFDTATLKLNGHERFSARKASYFRVVQPYQHHTSAPNRHIHVYSFALKPEEHQPSGTCNFSRIDNAQLELKSLTNALSMNLIVYAVNYNVLRIMSGMGGLAYSN